MFPDKLIPKQAQAREQGSKVKKKKKTLTPAAESREINQRRREIKITFFYSCNQPLDY